MNRHRKFAGGNGAGMGIIFAGTGGDGNISCADRVRMGTIYVRLGWGWG